MVWKPFFVEKRRVPVGTRRFTSSLSRPNACVTLLRASWQISCTIGVDP